MIPDLIPKHFFSQMHVVLQCVSIFISVWLTFFLLRCIFMLDELLFLVLVLDFLEFSLLDWGLEGSVFIYSMAALV